MKCSTDICFLNAEIARDHRHTCDPHRHPYRLGFYSLKVNTPLGLSYYHTLPLLLIATNATAPTPRTTGTGKDDEIHSFSTRPA